MTAAANWRDVKAKAREVDPAWDTQERVKRRAGYRSQMLASVSGAQLAEAAGLSQAQISQIENGEAASLDVLRAYIVGLGGQLGIVARIGNIHLNVA